MKIGISKSKYVSFCRCPKLLWLEKNKPQFASVSEASKSRLDIGNEVGDLAMELFGDYIDVTTYKDEKLDLEKMSNLTKKLIEEEYKNICEASFIDDMLYCAVDILRKANDGYEIYEIKSTTEVADYHYLDVAFQNYVLNKKGIKVTNSYVVTINNEYKRFNELELDKFFKINCVTDKVKKLIADVKNNVEKAIETLKNSDEPNCILSSKCDKPFVCSFRDYCFKEIPLNSVFQLANNRKKYDYYAENIVTFEDIKNSIYFDELTYKNKMQIDFELEKKDIYINKENIQKFIDNLKYPLYFLDFETYQQVIPLFDDVRPFNQIPFQYSLHIKKSKESELIHKEFLAKEGTDPRYALAKQLCEDIHEGTIIAYNASFEKTVIKDLGFKYKDLKNKLISFDEMFVDLMDPFKNYDIYHRDFKGSYSIKYVLPALFPNDQSLDYKNLDLIHNGSEAMTLFQNLEKYPFEKREEIRKSLLKYCELDTFAMVKILDKLYEYIKTSN